jgi:hypothetical protein
LRQANGWIKASSSEVLCNHNAAVKTEGYSQGVDKVVTRLIVRAIEFQGQDNAAHYERTDYLYRNQCTYLLVL